MSEWIYLFNCVSKLNQINLINSQQQSQEVKLKPIIKTQQQFQSDYIPTSNRSSSAPTSPTFKRQQSTNVKFIDQQLKQQALYPQQPLYPQQQQSTNFNRTRLFNNSTRSDSIHNLGLAKVDYKPIYDAFEKPVADYPLSTSLSQQTLDRNNDNHQNPNNDSLIDNHRRFKSDQNLTFEKNSNKNNKHWSQSHHSAVQSNNSNLASTQRPIIQKNNFTKPQYTSMYFDK